MWVIYCAPNSSERASGRYLDKYIQSLLKFALPRAIRITKQIFHVLILIRPSIFIIQLIPSLIQGVARPFPLLPGFRDRINIPQPVSEKPIPIRFRDFILGMVGCDLVRNLEEGVTLVNEG